MKKVEVFFDYACPYCLRAHEFLRELAGNYPQIELDWRPCEAHPRPEVHEPHSDLCVQGFFFAKEQGADLWEYHERMFRAAQKDRINIADAGALASSVEGLLDPAAFRAALEQGTYSELQLKNNDDAYERSGVWAVPAYRADGDRLDAVEGVGVTKEQIAEFLERHAAGK